MLLVATRTEACLRQVKPGGMRLMQHRPQRAARNAMTIRNLDLMFAPRSVAVIGASERAGSVGATVWKNLRHGAFQGPCWAVNSRHSFIGEDPVYPDIA